MVVLRNDGWVNKENSSASTEIRKTHKVGKERKKFQPLVPLFSLPSRAIAKHVMRHSSHRPNETPVLGFCYLFGHENKTGVVHILIIIQDRSRFSHINGKLSPKPFE